jgi:integrase
MAKVLTDLSVRHAKPKRRNGVVVVNEIPDAGCNGLYLLVHPTGHLVWAVRYRFAGRSRKLTLGKAVVVNKGERVPEHALTLSLARVEATKALHKVAALHIDPGTEKTLRKAEQKSAHDDSFEAIARNCFKRESQLRSASRQLRNLERLVFPEFGSKPISTVKRSDIVRCLDKIEDSSGPVMSDMCLSSISKVCNWHAKRSDDFRTPLARGMQRSKPRERARDRILTDAELRALWATGTVPGPFSAFVKFLLLTAARRNEARSLRWSEISVEQVWTLPAARNKTKKELARPLSQAAQAVLAGLPRIVDCDFCFTSDGKRAINSDARYKRVLDQASGVTNWRLHDLRRTARSLMSRANVPHDIAERALGHVMPAIRGVYDRHDFLPQMKLAFEALASLIEAIVHPTDNVVPMVLR